MLIFKYYILTPYENSIFKEKGDLYEYAFVWDEDDNSKNKTKITPKVFLKSKIIRDNFYKIMSDMVYQKIKNNHDDKFLWWSCNVFDEDANFLYSYGKTFNKKLVS